MYNTFFSTSHIFQRESMQWLRPSANIQSLLIWLEQQDQFYLWNPGPSTKVDIQSYQLFKHYLCQDTPGQQKNTCFNYVTFLITYEISCSYFDLKPNCLQCTAKTRVGVPVLSEETSLRNFIIVPLNKPCYSALHTAKSWPLAARRHAVCRKPQGSSISFEVMIDVLMS